MSIGNDWSGDTELVYFSISDINCGKLQILIGLLFQIRINIIMKKIKIRKLWLNFGQNLRTDEALRKTKKSI